MPLVSIYDGIIKHKFVKSNLSFLDLILFKLFKYADFPVVYKGSMGWLIKCVNCHSFYFTGCRNIRRREWIKDCPVCGKGKCLNMGFTN